MAYFSWTLFLISSNRSSRFCRFNSSSWQTTCGYNSHSQSSTWRSHLNSETHTFNFDTKSRSAFFWIKSVIQSGSDEELLVGAWTAEVERTASPSCSRAAASCLFFSSWSVSQLSAPHIRLRDLPYRHIHTSATRLKPLAGEVRDTDHCYVVHMFKWENWVLVLLFLDMACTQTHRSSWTFKDANFALVKCSVQGIHKLLLDVVGLVWKRKLSPGILHVSTPAWKTTKRFSNFTSFT